MTNRVLPRRLAFVLLALFSVNQGVSLLLTLHAANHSLVHVRGPLWIWAVGFCALGALIPLGILDKRAAIAASTAGILYWAVWAWMISGAVSHQGVTLRAVTAPLGNASLYLLLAPYLRRYGDQPAPLPRDV